MQAAENDSRWVRQKLADLETQVRAAENKVESYKSADRIVTTEGLRSNEQQVADLTKELGTARARASEAKARLDQVQRIAKQGQIEASADALKSPVIERRAPNRPTANAKWRGSRKRSAAAIPHSSRHGHRIRG